MERIPTVGVVIIDDDKVLLVEHGEKAGHLTGSYGTPGGRIDEGESAIQAAVREVNEETGLTVEVEDLVEIPYIYEAELPRKDGSILSVSHTVFVASKFKGELRGTDETVPVWMEIDKLNTSELLANTEDMVKRALNILNT